MPEAPKLPHGTQFVAVLLPDSQKILDDTLYYGPMIQGLNDGLLDRGIFMRPVQCLHEHQKEQFLHSPAGLYRGAVFLGAIYQYDLFIRAVIKRIVGPKVMLDHHLEDVPIHSVREDAVAGMRLLVEHLVGLGHRRIAYLDHARPETNPWKRQGLNLGLRNAGLPELARGWVAGCRPNFADISAALEWFMDLKPRPTAVICFDDGVALFLLQAAAERGLRIPLDLSIAGYGDFAVTSGRSGMLTSVRMDVRLMGHKAAELAAGPAEAPPRDVLVPPALVARGTTAAPPPDA